MILLFFFGPMLIVMIVPLVLLVALPISGAIFLRRHGARWSVSFIPLLVPLATLASEAYPMWLVRKIASEPISAAAKSEAVGSIYTLNGYAPDAVRLVVQFPGLQFAEGIVDEVRYRDGSVFKWERMPVGLIRFQGRRTVAQASDCGDHEVSVPITAFQYPYKATWYCTAWMPIKSSKARYAIGFSTRKYKIGPFSIFLRRDFVKRRADNHPVNTLISVSMTGGIWWHFTEWLGDATNISALANGNTVGYYGASTAEYLIGSGTPEEFLMTGQR